MRKFLELVTEFAPAARPCMASTRIRPGSIPLVAVGTHSSTKVVLTKSALLLISLAPGTSVDEERVGGPKHFRPLIWVRSLPSPPPGGGLPGVGGPTHSLVRVNGTIRPRSGPHPGGGGGVPEGPAGSRSHPPPGSSGHGPLPRANASNNPRGAILLEN